MAFPSDELQPARQINHFLPTFVLGRHVFYHSNKKAYEGSKHEGSTHGDSIYVGSMHVGSIRVGGTHVDSTHVGSMHVEVRQHLEGVDSLPYLGPELTSSALLTGTFFLLDEPSHQHGSLSFKRHMIEKTRKHCHAGVLYSKHLENF